MNLRQHVDQELRLRAIVRGIAVDFEKVGQAVDQVIDGRREIGAAVAAAPLIEKQAVAFILLERGGVEDAQHIVVDAHGVDFVDALARGAPVKRVDILQHGEDSGSGQLLVQTRGQMSGSEVRFAEQHEDHGIGMALADLGDLCRSVTVARTDLAQVFTGHAIEAVDAFAVVACGHQQFVEWSPVISPIEIEADALAQFVLADFATPPFVEDVLIAGEDGFDSEHDRAISS